MKKYLITGMAAIVFCGAFTSCSHDLDSGGGTAANSIEETYEKAFITHFGEPAPTQTWGFGSSVSSTRAIDPSKPQGEDARGNMWAETWLVPDTLTAGQKLRVQKYFQYNQYPGDTHDPDLVNFFVQQVYDGHDDPLTKYDQTKVNDTLKYSTEEYLAANGTTWIQSGEHMDKLTAGSDNIHINNFNNGNCGVYPNVLDNGYVANDNDEHHHPDKIMLMLNTKTDCFGYWNSDGSCGHNDRYRLVSAQVIDDWIDSHTDLGFGPNYGDPVVDRWNRDFIGFDFDQLPDSACYAHVDTEKTNIKVATVNTGSEVFQYVWDGTKVIPVTGSAGIADRNITSDFNGIWNNLGSKETNSDGSIIYHSTSWSGGLSAWYAGSNTDFSSYTSVVVEFYEAPTVDTKLIVETGDAGGAWGSYEVNASPYANQIELNFAENNISSWHLANAIRQIAIQAAPGDIKIRRIYMKGVEGVQGYGTNLLVGDNTIRILTSETNEYCGDYRKRIENGVGDFYEEDNSATADNGIMGYHSDANYSNVKCLNLPFFTKMYNDGYLPVDTKQYREWVKIGGCADGYFSDWIVTISKANPKGDTPPPPVVVTGDSIVVIAEDLTINDAIPDFDFNDVVFMVKWDKTANTVNVKLLAAGGTLPLYIGGTDGVFTDGVEVHAKFAEVNPDKVITTGTMINTWAGRHTEYKTPTFEVTNFNHNATTIGEVAASIKVAVKKYDRLYELVAPAGQVPTKIAVMTDFVTDSHLGWCDERQDIDDKYKLVNGTPLFKDYVIGNIGDDWYRMILDDIESTQH